MDRPKIIEPNEINSKKEESYFTKVDSPAMIKDLSDLDKPMEKLSYHGSQALSDSELLAILLGSGYKGVSALELANRVLSHVGNHEILMNISIEELMAIKGIGLAKASRIVAALELGLRMMKKASLRTIKISSPAEVAKIFCHRYRFEEKEHFSILMLDSKNQVIGEAKISTGDLNRSIVNPREVFKEAIRRSANGIILVHNHPSGDTRPSKEDINVTKRLIEGGQILGILVLDHIIVGGGEDEYFSMKEESII